MTLGDSNGGMIDEESATYPRKIKRSMDTLKASLESPRTSLIDLLIIPPKPWILLVGQPMTDLREILAPGHCLLENETVHRLVDGLDAVGIVERKLREEGCLNLGVDAPVYNAHCVDLQGFEIL